MKTNKKSPFVPAIAYVIALVLPIVIALIIRYGEYLQYSDYFPGISFWDYLWLFGGRR